MKEGFNQLSQPVHFERPKNITERLTNMLHDIASDINIEVEKKFGVIDLVNPDCTVSMSGFSNKKKGGIYQDEVVQGDSRKIKEMEIVFSGAEKPRVQEFHKTKGINTVEDIVEHWRENKVRGKSGQAEIAISILLHKVLHEKFLVVRASTYDDYNGGVDNIVLNKETGEVICAFDEVHDSFGGKETNKKIEKIQKIALKGGAKARYGIQLENVVLTRSKMENIPVFYLSLNQDELAELLAHMNYDPHGNQTAIERMVFSKLVQSLREQKIFLESLNGLIPILKEKLRKFENTLETLESFVPSQG